MKGQTYSHQLTHVGLDIAFRCGAVLQCNVMHQVLLGQHLMSQNQTQNDGVVLNDRVIPSIFDDLTKLINSKYQRI